MYMNLKPNKHKRISFTTTTMTSLGFIGPLPVPKILAPSLNLAPPPNLIFCSGPPQLFWSEMFWCPPPLKLEGGGAATMKVLPQWALYQLEHKPEEPYQTS